MRTLSVDAASSRARVVRSTDRLDRKTELELARRWQGCSDREAAEALARAHLGLVTAIAKRQRGHGVSLAELIAEGNYGIVQALYWFDPERQLRFGAYARPWIRASMLAHVVRSWSLVGGSTGPVRPRLFFRLRRERDRIVSLRGEGSHVQELLAQRLGLSLERVRELLTRLDHRDVSLDVPLGPGAAACGIDMLAGSHDPEQSLAEAQVASGLRRAVNAALERLDARERFVIEHRIMASRDEARTRSEIALALGIRRERAAQLEVRATRKLRAAFASQPDPLLRDWLAETCAGAHAPEHDHRSRTA